MLCWLSFLLPSVSLLPSGTGEIYDFLSLRTHPRSIGFTMHMMTYPSDFKSWTVYENSLLIFIISINILVMRHWFEIYHYFENAEPPSILGWIMYLNSFLNWLNKGDRTLGISDVIYNNIFELFLYYIFSLGCREWNSKIVMISGLSQLIIWWTVNVIIYLIFQKGYILMKARQHRRIDFVLQCDHIYIAFSLNFNRRVLSLWFSNHFPWYGNG